MSARRVLQEKPQGEFATLWKTSLEEDTGLEQVELNAALADIMAATNFEQVTATDFAALAREREARSRAKGPAPVPLQSGATAAQPVRPTAAQAWHGMRRALG